MNRREKNFHGISVLNFTFIATDQRPELVIVFVDAVNKQHLNNNSGIFFLTKRNMFHSVLIILLVKFQVFGYRE